MSTSPAPLLRICHFESPFLPLQPYFCYDDEICCKDGCCSPHQYKNIESWHFWYKIYIVLGVLIFIVFYRSVCWFCRKGGRRDAPRDDDTANSHVVNLMVSYNNRNGGAPKEENDITDPPPLYNVAIHLPKPHNNDEVPTYEQATSMKY